MTVQRIVHIIAGTLILLSLALGAESSPLFQNIHWLWLSVFVGANLLQSGITRWCLMDQILTKLGVPIAEHCMRKEEQQRHTREEDTGNDRRAR